MNKQLILEKYIRVSVKKALKEQEEQQKKAEKALYLVYRFPGLKKIMEDLMSPVFGRFVGHIEIVAPKPTTFNVELINGQDFSIIYAGKGNFTIKISGKKYDPNNLGELERASQSIADLLQLNYAPEEGKEQQSSSDAEIKSDLEKGGIETPPEETPEEETPSETPPPVAEGFKKKSNINVIEEIMKEFSIKSKKPSSGKLKEAKSKKEKPAEEDTSDIGKIMSTLKSAGIRKDVLNDIKNVLLDYNENQLKNFIYNFRKYDINNITDIYKTFSDFFNITTQGLGKGEVMLIIGLEDSKSGGTSSKDIEVKGEIYEVKELTNGEFKLASDGYISGTAYLQNLTTFKKYLTKEVVPALDITEDEANILYDTINYYTKNEPNNASREFINNLERSCKILKQSITKTSIQTINYITVKGKKIAISDEDWDKIQAGSGPVTISFGDEVNEVKVNLSKLDKHPWVLNPKEVKDNLNIIWNKFLSKMKGMIFFNYPGKSEGVKMDIEEVKKNFTPFRINLNSLTAKENSTINQKKEIDEKYNTKYRIK